MNKKELTNAIAERTGLSKFESRKVLNAVIEIITEEMVRNGRLLLIGFGTFSVKQKAARKGMNPSTFAPIDIPAKKIASFKPSIYLNFLLNRKKRGRKKTRAISSTFSIITLRNPMLGGITTPAMKAPNRA